MGGGTGNLIVVVGVEFSNSLEASPVGETRNRLAHALAPNMATSHAWALHVFQWSLYNTYSLFCRHMELDRLDQGDMSGAQEFHMCQSRWFKVWYHTGFYYYSRTVAGTKSSMNCVNWGFKLRGWFLWCVFIYGHTIYVENTS